MKKTILFVTVLMGLFTTACTGKFVKADDSQGSLSQRIADKP
jgi:hypothetical protein